MYRDTEEAYGNFTLDVFQDNSGLWCCDYRDRGNSNTKGLVKARRRKDAVLQAKQLIDHQLTHISEAESVPLKE